MALRSILGTRDPAKGWGLINGGLYSNTRLDELLAQGLATMDPAARATIVAQATEVGISDLGAIPLHYDVVSWGLRKGITYPARADNYSFSWEFRPTAP